MSAEKKRTPKNIFVEGPVAAEFVGQSIAKHSTKHDIGAHELFLGQVRGDKLNEGSSEKFVESINFTAYNEMALEAMHEIREATFAKFEITCMHVYHSLGAVKVGELCFCVFASAGHRVAARKAVAYVVDRIKDELPIFGEERFSDGSTTWKKNR